MFRTKLLILLTVALLAVMGSAGLVQAESHEDAEDPVRTAVIWDNFTLSDAITYTMEDVPDAGEGMAYEGWLVSDDGTLEISTGVMGVVDGVISHTWTSVEGQNLIQHYDTVRVTIESVPDDDAASSGTIAFSDRIPSGSMAHIRHLLTGWPAGADQGILTNLKEELDIALTQANLAGSAQTIEAMKGHLEQTINAIEGPSGSNYGDLDGNGSIEDAGDGEGVLGHAGNRDHSGLASAAAPSNTQISAGALLVDQYGANAESWALEAKDAALVIMSQSNLDYARALTATVIGPLHAARNGIVAAGDGGAQQAYVEAQKMAAYSLNAGAGGSGDGSLGLGVGLPATGDSRVIMLMQLALVIGMATLVTGGYLLLRGRNWRPNI